MISMLSIGLLLGILSQAAARERSYYLAIQEIYWDYAPSGLNLITNNRLQDEPISRIYSELFIGKQYKKAVFRSYTDETYQVPLPHDPNLGFMGPTLHTEVGDSVTIHLFNNASHEFSIHPHGAFYTKANEGARYQDNDTAKADDGVPSGGRHVYEWQITPEFGPAQDDPNCLTWAYHSHTNSEKDINSGLIGAMLVCRPGIYRENESRTDVDHEFVALFFISDENDSWYFEENLMTIPDWESIVDNSPESFERGNEMHVVNAYMYANTPGYNVCQGDTISWHVLGMGSNLGLHPIQFQGQTITSQHHRKDSLILIPATFSTLLMRANNPGRWYVASKLYSDFTEGMSAWLTVDPSCRNLNAPLPSESLTGQLRQYFISIEEILWDYAPSGLNRLNNESLLEPESDSEVFFANGPDRIGGVYKKAVFRRYTDDTFSEPLVRSPDHGFLGPVIFGEIGDAIQIRLRNTASHKAFNIEPHGVYFQDSYAVPPNSERTFTWTLPDDVSPTDADPNCLTYIYTSTVSFVEDSNSGLVGPLLVCKRGTLTSELDKAHKYILMTVFNENKSWYFKENINRFTNSSSIDVTDDDFVESNLMHSMNGLMFGNLELDLCSDRNTTLHVMSIGTNVDIHGIDLEGINVRVDGVNSGVVDVFAHTFHTVNIQPNFVGKGRMYCRTIDHTVTGMSGLYNSAPCGSSSLPREESSPATRVCTGTPYYIAAEEVIWDYNPRRVNIFGESTDTEGVDGYIYEHHEPGQFIGSRYKKVLYFEYTDDTFTTRKSKPGHLGAFGPIIKGEVGGSISVLFFNNASRPYNMYPWGAIDEKANNLDDQAVHPGQRKQYIWKIPESASPSENQPACQSFVYLSNVDPAIDPIDGLIGPLLVCKKDSFPGGIAPQEPISVQEEFFLLFLIFDENLSHYRDENIRLFLGADPETFESTEEFEESNKMKAINGRLWHVDDLVMMRDDLVRWHLIGWGNEEDFHSVHFHAHTYTHVNEGNHRGDVFDTFPGFIGTVEMRVVAIGDWLLHCHVFDHMHSGMQTVYKVVERPAEITESELEPESRQYLSRKLKCQLVSENNKHLVNCDGANITHVRDFTFHRREIPIRFPGGNVKNIDVKSVLALSLNDNFLTTRAARYVLSAFENLCEIRLDGNRLEHLSSSFLNRASSLRFLSVKRNALLQSVGRLLLTTKSGHRKGSIQNLDLSENEQLNPSCLNRIFTNVTSFENCAKTRE